MKRPILSAGRALAVAAAAAALWLPPALAVDAPATVEQTGAGADLVVHGRVRSVEARWNRDRSSIYSEVSVSVGRMLARGTSASSNRNVRAASASSREREVTFLVPGGVVDGVGMISSHQPRPKEGDDVVVFLAAEGAPERTRAAEAAGRRAEAATQRFDADAQTLTLVGGEQGWFPVRDGAVSVRGRAASVDELMSTAERSLKN